MPFLHHNLKLARQDVGVSQRQVSKAVRCSTQTVLHWEHGDSCPTLEKLDRLVTVFKILYQVYAPEMTPRTLYEEPNAEATATLRPESTAELPSSTGAEPHRQDQG